MARIRQHGARVRASRRRLPVGALAGRVSRRHVDDPYVGARDARAADGRLSRFRAFDDRDPAHVSIIPARFVTGVDYGAEESLGPPDFHSYVEAFIGDRWWLFDPTGITPLTGLVRIGTGRDAADVAFATMFGNVQGRMPRVAFAAAEDPAAGIARPQPTTLAVSTVPAITASPSRCPRASKSLCGDVPRALHATRFDALFA